MKHVVMVFLVSLFVSGCSNNSKIEAQNEQLRRVNEYMYDCEKLASLLKAKEFSYNQDTEYCIIETKHCKYSYLSKYIKNAQVAVGIYEQLRDSNR